MPQQRRVVIGVVGGNGVPFQVGKEVRALAAKIVTSGLILLTGGDGQSKRFDKDEYNVKDEAITSAQETEKESGITARLICILPSNERNWLLASPSKLMLYTGVRSAERDPINGLTPDVLIVFRGGAGTLCELAFAMEANKKILFWKAVESLDVYLKKHSQEVQECIGSALLGPAVTPRKTRDAFLLLTILKQGLQSASDYSATPDSFVKEAIVLAGQPDNPTGFPGFNDDRTSKSRFEKIVRSISRCP